jgi:hypothetical protein
MVYRMELCRCLCRCRCRCLRLYVSGDVWVEAAARDPSACFSVLAALPCLPCLVFVHRLALPSFALVHCLASHGAVPCLLGFLVFLSGLRLRLRLGNICFSYLDGMQ